MGVVGTAVEGSGKRSMGELVLHNEGEGGQGWEAKSGSLSR